MIERQKKFYQCNTNFSFKASTAGKRSKSKRKPQQQKWINLNFSHIHTHTHKVCLAKKLLFSHSRFNKIGFDLLQVDLKNLVFRIFPQAFSQLSLSLESSKVWKIYIIFCFFLPSPNFSLQQPLFCCYSSIILLNMIFYRQKAMRERERLGGGKKKKSCIRWKWFNFPIMARKSLRKVSSTSSGVFCCWYFIFGEQQQKNSN